MTVGPWVLRCANNELAVLFPGFSRGQITMKGYCLRRWWVEIIRDLLQGCINTHPAMRLGRHLIDHPGPVVMFATPLNDMTPLRMPWSSTIGGRL